MTDVSLPGSELRGAPAHILSPCEREVVRWAGEGLLTKEIAARMGRSERTVKNQLSAAMLKLSARGRVELLRNAVRSGELPCPLCTDCTGAGFWRNQLRAALEEALDRIAASATQKPT